MGQGLAEPHRGGNGLGVDALRLFHTGLEHADGIVGADRGGAQSWLSRFSFADANDNSCSGYFPTLFD